MTATHPRRASKQSATSGRRDGSAKRGGRLGKAANQAAIAARIPFRIRPMLATLVDEPFHRHGWVYEEKYDGIRILAYKEGSSVELRTRNDIERSQRFPTIAATLARLAPRTLLLDGEIVAIDARGVSRFQLLQRGGEPIFAVFDCLYVDGRDLRRQPLRERRRILRDVLPLARDLRLARRLPADGLRAYGVAKKAGFEGLVGKNQDSDYDAGRRSHEWLKVKVRKQEEFVIGGFTKPSGSRQHLGALLLGAFDRQGRLHYVGKVGAGFTRGSLADLAQRLRPLVRKRPAFVNPPRSERATWIAPRLVAQIAFQEWTRERKLRQPVYLGLREDKAPPEVRLPGGTT